MGPPERAPALPVSWCDMWPRSLAAAVFAQVGVFTLQTLPDLPGATQALLGVSLQQQQGAPAGHVCPMSLSPGMAWSRLWPLAGGPWGGAPDAQDTWLYPGKTEPWVRT